MIMIFGFPLALVAAVFAWLGCSLFVVLYARVRWWESAEGRNVMLFMILVGCLSMIGIVRRMVGDDPANFLATIAWTAIGVIAFWRSVLLLRAQGFHHDRTDKEKPCP